LRSSGAAGDEKPADGNCLGDGGCVRGCWGVSEWALSGAADQTPGLTNLIQRFLTGNRATSNSPYSLLMRSTLAASAATFGALAPAAALGAFGAAAYSVLAVGEVPTSAALVRIAAPLRLPLLATTAPSALGAAAAAAAVLRMLWGIATALMGMMVVRALLLLGAVEGAVEGGDDGCRQG